jgi:hypothetical protein
MSSEARLVPASIVFAVLWTVGMIFWSGHDTVSIVILTVGGAVAGVMWFFLMRAFTRWQTGQRG